jgi:hypothetical protein
MEVERNILNSVIVGTRKDVRAFPKPPQTE